MGASSSTDISQQVTSQIENVVNKAVVKIAQTCSGSTNTNQNITLGNLNGSSLQGVDQSASATLNMSCLQSSSNNTQLQSQIMSDLQNQLKQEATSNPTIANANISTVSGSTFNTLSQNVSNSVDINTIKACSANATGNQSITAGNINNSNVGELTQSLTENVVFKCIQDDNNVSSAVSALSSYITNQTQQSTTSGLDPVEMIFIILIAIVILYVIFYVL